MSFVPTKAKQSIEYYFYVDFSISLALILFYESCLISNRNDVENFDGIA